MPFHWENFFNISPPLVVFLLSGIKPRQNLKNKASCRFQRLSDLAWPGDIFQTIFFLHLLASSIQVDATSHTTWPHSLIPQILIHLEEFKGNLSENPSWINLKRFWTCCPGNSCSVNVSFHDIEEQLLFLVLPLNSSSTLWIRKETLHSIHWVYLYPDKTVKGGAWLPV